MLMAAYPHLVSLEVMTCPSVEHIMISLVLFMTARRQSPDCILKAHGWPLVGSRVKGLEISPWVDNGNECMLSFKVNLVPATGKQCS